MTHEPVHRLFNVAVVPLEDIFAPSDARTHPDVSSLYVKLQQRIVGNNGAVCCVPVEQVCRQMNVEVSRCVWPD